MEAVARRRPKIVMAGAGTMGARDGLRWQTRRSRPIVERRRPTREKNARGTRGLIETLVRGEGLCDICQTPEFEDSAIVFHANAIKRFF